MMVKDMLVRLLSVAVCASSLAAFAARQPSRVDVSSQPAGAKVSVDGEVRGATPLQLFDLGLGSHAFHVEAPGFRAADAVVKVGGEGSFVQKNFELEVEKALILVKSEPLGAEVRNQGLALGVTPLFVGSLATDDEYVFELSRPGYRSVKVSAAPKGRVPVVVTGRLPIDSGTLECVSDPAGAEVMVNGVVKGVTPLVVTEVARGDATVVFKLAGYKSETRQVVVSPDGRSQKLEVKLAGQPGTLKIVSTPEGAKVFVDGNYQGKAPCSVADLPAGEHQVRLELDGHATEERTVKTSNGGEFTEEFKLVSVLGRLEIVTDPANAKVMVDGRAVGTTRAIQGSTKSAVLSIEKLPAGERSVLVSAIGCQDVSRKVKIPPKGTANVTIRLKQLFVIDTEVELVSGAIKRGRLVGDGQQLDGVHLEIKPGWEELIPHGNIRRLKPIKDN